MSARPFRRQSRSVTLVYGSVAVVLLAVIATVALVLQPPAPPAVAEFAPQAVERIDESRRDQSSAFGSGEGNCAEGVACEGVLNRADEGGQGSGEKRRATTSVDERRVLRCVGDPPRQIEDPQSPPCVNYWDGDNGGPTWRGVTANEILVGWASKSPEEERVDELFVEFFNRRFQFYGRKLRLVRYRINDDPTQPSTMRAAASSLDELGVFAAMPYFGTLPARPFYDDLARNRILSVSDVASYYTERGDYTPKAPYQWSYGPSIDAIGRNVAQWICRTLAGRTADLAGVGTRGADRKFALMVPRAPGGTADTSDLQEALRGCDVYPRRVEYDPVFDESDPKYRAMVADLQHEGVTSIACYCSGAERQSLMAAASDLHYYPEWLTLPFEGQDHDFDGTTQPADQRGQVFGITATNRWNEWSSSPWMWALKEVDPEHREQTPPVSLNAWVRPLRQYEPLLLLASGIQMAGPNLTPHTFETGLFKTRFPNPRSGQAPYYQAHVGFGPGDHSMVDDYAAIWFDPSARSHYSGPGGAQCYIGRGTRWSLGWWPDAPLPFHNAATGCR